jgi:PST family polysaccharide transporter
VETTLAVGLSSGVRWSAVSVVGREGARMVFTIVLARVVGPEGFGIVAQALVYVGIVSLLLDQGFSSALIQREKLEDGLPGAVVTVNMTIGLLLTLLTIVIAPAWAAFMSTPALTMVLSALALSLLIRSVAVTPRAMLTRTMQFRTIGIADVSSAVIGGSIGMVMALLGAQYWALVGQIVTTDLALVAVLLAFGAVDRPNLQLRRLREIAGFSGRSFAAGLLVTSISRNIDNLLVGRFQGPEALAFYGLAYRLLLLPVQLLSYTIGAVLFPSFSRYARDLDAARALLARSTRGLGVVSIPSMALVAAAAPQVVPLLFGPAWAPAVPIVQVLAMTGALQAIYYSTSTPVILGLGRADLNLRLAIATTVVSVVGIVAGLPFGPLGVGVGYSVATAVLVPVEWLIRRRLLDVSLRAQAATLLPGLHAGVWTAAGYFAVELGLDGNALVTLAVGVPAALIAGAAALRVAHRALFFELLDSLARVAGGRGRAEGAEADPEVASER